MKAGKLVIALVSSLSVSQAALGSAIWTDKSDYAPAENVIISSSGFNALENVTVTIERPDNRGFNSIGLDIHVHLPGGVDR